MVSFTWLPPSNYQYLQSLSVEASQEPQIWLPPLNSHDQHAVSVEASQEEKFGYDSSIEDPIFEIHATVSVTFYSDNINNRRTFEGLSFDNGRFRFDCRDLHAALRYLFNNLYIPFELNEMRLERNYLDGLKVYYGGLLPKDGLVSKIGSFVSDLNYYMYYAGDNILHLKLKINKRVTIPDSELREWCSWYDEKMKVDPGFDKLFRDAISRRRTMAETVNEASLSFKAAGKLSIEELDKLTYCLDDGDDDSCRESSCVICYQNFLPGSEITQLPCKHIFHGDCIVKWLRESHLCPLCRFPLPTN